MVVCLYSKTSGIRTVARSEKNDNFNDMRTMREVLVLFKSIEMCDYCC